MDTSYQFSTTEEKIADLEQMLAEWPVKYGYESYPSERRKEAVLTALEALRAQHEMETTSHFHVNSDMFGTYVKIPTGYSERKDLYKVISKSLSNAYCDVPLRFENPKVVIHGVIVPILKVVHCGVNESKIIRVPLSECEIIHPAKPKNNPLSFNELQAMVGKPVWIEWKDKSPSPTGAVAQDQWVIVVDENLLVFANGRHARLYEEDYINTFVAYRKPPSDDVIIA